MGTKNKNSTASKREICPASYFEGLEGGKPHFTTRLQLKQNGGVCRKCRIAFNKKHARHLKRKEPKEFEIQHQPLTHDQEVHFADGHREPSVEFDYAALDNLNGHRNAALDFASTAIQKFCLRLVTKGEDSPERIWANINALLYAAQIHPNQTEKLQWFAKRYGTGNLGNFSLDVEYWRDLFGLPRTGSAKHKRERSRQAAREVHERKGHNIKNLPVLAPVLRAISTATRWLNKENVREAIKCAGTRQKNELVDAMKPFTTLREALSNYEGSSFRQIESLG